MRKRLAQTAAGDAERDRWSVRDTPPRSVRAHPRDGDRETVVPGQPAGGIMSATITGSLLAMVFTAGMAVGGGVVGMSLASRLRARQAQDDDTEIDRITAGYE